MKVLLFLLLIDSMIQAAAAQDIKTVAARGEYLSDRGGLFSGTTQALNETTFTLECQFEPDRLVRAEYRPDFSNQVFSLTIRPAHRVAHKAPQRLALSKRGN